MNIKEMGDFSIPCTPRPQACSTVTRDTNIEFAHNSVNGSPTKLNEESSAFINALNVSDLERDELYCKQNWTYLPLEKFNFSVTAVENSKIIPPNFMPTEDSLFKEFKPSVSEPVTSHSTNDISIFSSFKKVLSSEKILGEESFLKNKTSPEGENCSTGFGIPTIQDISLALRSCDDNANPLSLMDEILRAGEKSSSNDLVLTDNYSLTYEDVVIFSSVELNAIELGVIHLTNDYINTNMKFEFKLDGSHAFRMLQDFSGKDSITKGFMKKKIPEIFIVFNPTVFGPATATLTILSNMGQKKVLISGFGGKSNLVIHNLHLNIMDLKKIISFDADLTAKFQLQNIGSAPAFYYIYFGELEYFFHSDDFCGLLNPGKTNYIKLSVNKNRSVLISLLNFFASRIFTEVGTITIYYGEEASRQRLKRLCRSHKHLTSTSIGSLPHIFHDYPDIPFNLENMADNVLAGIEFFNSLQRLNGALVVYESIPLLIHEGISQVHVTPRMSKSFVTNALSKITYKSIC